MPTDGAFSLTGSITDAQGHPVADAQVQSFATLRGVRQPRRVGAATTDVEGRYGIDVPAPTRGVWLQVSIRVSMAGRPASESPVHDAQAPRTIVDLQLDLRSDEEPPFRVRGTVRDELGDPVPGVTVLAFDRDLRSEELLGRTTSGEDAGYEIRYSPDQFRRDDKEFADLFLRALGAHDEMLAESRIVFNAPPDALVDLQAGRTRWVGPSEWETRTATLLPLLGAVQPAELREDDTFDDISFLSGETGYTPLDVGRWSACFRIAQRVAEQDRPLSPEAVYAFVRQGEPSVFRDQLLEDMRHPERIPLIEDALIGGLAELSTDLQVSLLESAVAESLVPARLTRDVPTIVQTLAALRVSRTGDRSLGAGKGTVGQLLQAAHTPDADQQVIMEALSTRVVPLDEFWSQLQSDARVSTDTVRRVRTTFELGGLTRSHIPLVSVLADRIASGELPSNRDLAKLSPADWKTLLSTPQPDGSVIGAPANMDGETEDDRLVMYATILAQQFERRFPTTSFAAEVARSPEVRPEESVTAAFLEANPAFQLDRFRVDHYLAQDRTALDTLDDPAAAVTAIKAVQRVFKLNPTFTAVDALMTRGITSAQQVYFMGQTQFTAALTDSGVNGMDALRMYRRAESTYATALATFADLNVALNGPVPAAVPAAGPDAATRAAVAALPSLQALFGSLDYCECTQCRSVYSESAYFVDILRFLGDRGTRGTGTNAGKNVRDVLFGRRPDLGDIELSCQNSNTPLPYIDLVNEVLERAVAPAATAIDAATEADLVAGPVRPALVAELVRTGMPITADAQVYAPDSRGRWGIRDASHSYAVATDAGALSVSPTWQTVGTADEVRANPEHVQDAAYVTLANAVYPPSLPFDLSTEEVRVHLSGLGTTFPRLLELFRQTTAGGTSPSDSQLDHARLGMTEPEAQVITGTLVGPSPWDFWGLAEAANDVPHPMTPTDPTTRLTGTWIEVLSTVPALLHRSGLTLRQLLQLLDLRFVNPAGAIQVRQSADTDAAACDPSTFTVAGLDEDALGRITRFVRLWRRLGVPMWEVDIALHAAAPDPDVPAPLTDATLSVLAGCTRLAARTSLPLPVVTSVFAGFDDHEYVDRSADGSPVVHTLYRSLFSNRLVDASGGFPPVPSELSGTVGDRIPGVLAAMRLSEPDLELILADQGLTPAAPLDADALARIHRVAVLANAAGLRIVDHLALVRLWGSDPYADATAAGELLDVAARVRRSRFTPAELLSLLGPTSPTQSGAGLEDRTVAAFLRSLRPALDEMTTATVRQPDTTRADYVAAHIGSLPTLTTDADAGAALALVMGTWAGDESDRDALVDRCFTGVVDDLTAARTALAALPGGLTPADREAAVEQRLSFVQPPLEAFLVAARREAIVVQHTAGVLGLDQPIAGLLLARLHLPGETAPLLEVVGDPDLLVRDAGGAFAHPLDETGFPRLHRALRLLHKVTLVIDRLAMTADTVQWWVTGTHAADLDWLQAGSLPLDAGTVLPLEQWMAMESFFHLTAELPPSTRTPVDYLSELVDPAGTSADALAALAAITGWSPADLTSLVTAFGWLDPATAVDTVKVELRVAANLERLRECTQLLRALGVAAARAIAWATATPSPAVADETKQALKAKYDLPQWLEVIRPVQDALRERRRDALTAWLVARPDADAGQTWTDTNGLYSYYLIDVEMAACMLTTRVKQASASAQLFVQRVLLGLEPDVVADAAADRKWKQWTWMKHYRMWEANRKVFLYPENWIEPQLRDEKSPLFVELEQELQQKDVTADTVEDAYRTYLSKLDAVANLEIRSTYLEHLSPTESRLHVFGRTRASTGPTYYHRTRVNGARWTPWEEVGLDIHADHLMVGEHNRRLTLLWPQFVERAQHASQQKTPLENALTTIVEPTRFWEVRLYWSELRDGKWSPEVLSDTPHVIHHAQTNGDAPGRIGFRTRMLPQVRTRLFRTPDGAVTAPYGIEAFDKIGPQVQPEQASTTEQLIAPPMARYHNNLILHTGSTQYFWYSSVEEVGKGHQLGAHEGAQSIQLLNAIRPGRTYSVVDSSAAGFGGAGSFFTWDDARTYFVDYEHRSGSTYSSGVSHDWARSAFTFSVHYHPYVALFTRELTIGGLPGLLNRRIQVDPTSIPKAPMPFDFATYQPQPAVTRPLPVEQVDFDYAGPYAPYNWELFFHIPMYLGDRLAANQRHEEALQCYGYVFDPTNTDNTTDDPQTPQQKYWITKPFYLTTKAEYHKQKIENIMAAIARGDAELRAQVDEWRNNPYSPHLIARMRTVAYQKNVLIKYIQTIIAWADQLFSQDRMETVAEATQLYVMASELLGARPQSVPRSVPEPVKTYYQLQAEGIDDFSNVLTEIEGLLSAGTATSAPGEDAPELPRLDVLYFCIPQNDKLLTLWDTVDDRLFKVRNCMNIVGTVRQLPLVDPVLDPGALVRAAASGVDLSSAVADLNAPLPLYRFSSTIQRAHEVCAEVRALGGALQSALDKRDAESLAGLRSTHERAMLELVRQVRLDQISEAGFTRDALDGTRSLVEHRQQYYAQLLDEGLSGWEIASLALTGGAIVAEVVSTVLGLIASGTSLMPTFTAGAAGFGGSPYVTVGFGGENVSGGLSKAAEVSRSVGSILQLGAGMTATIGAHDRRAQEWGLSRDLAALELPQVDAQILAADLRRRIAERELVNHDAQVRNAAAEDEYLHAKFTNEELYDWTVTQLSSVYFQNYQLAFDLAKRAERCFRYELGLAESSYIRFGYWDGLRKGLLAGERLGTDLRRLESAYFQHNRREFELVKHVSLAFLDPVALVKLRQNGECFVDLPETLFDLDHPGHYFRRLKTVALSVPCTVGPYTSVSCTLTLTRDTVRTEPTLLAGEYARDTAAADPRFRDGITAVQSIATSSAVNDSGLFDLSFSDGRYLPFEGGGAVSTWHVQLTDTPAQFDHGTISDVVLHVRYTARDGGAALRAKATEDVAAVLNSLALADDRRGMHRVVDVARELPDEYHRFLHPATSDQDQVLHLGDLRDRLPWFTRSFPGARARAVEVAVKSAAGPFQVMLSPLGQDDADLLAVGADPTYTGLLRGARDLTGAEVPLDDWTLKMRTDGAADFRSLDPDDVQGLYLVVGYVVEAAP